MSALALALLVVSAPAHAQDDTFIRPAGTDCDENGGQPLVGTIGFTNARHALNTNIQTYSATAFADRTLFRSHRYGDGSDSGTAAFEQNITWGATTVPTYNSRAIDYAVNNDNCTPEYRVAMRPIDLASSNLGVAYHWSHFGFFYSASVAYGGVAYPHNYLRGMMYGLALPIYSTYALMAAPLVRTGYQTQTGASAFALDWIGGATYENQHIGVRVGYAGSAGLYGAVAEQRTGVYLSSVVRGSGSVLSQLETGLDRIRLSDQLGLTSAFLRDIPYGAGTIDSGGPRALLPDTGSLRTLHLEQDNLFHLLDLHVAQTLRPVAQLHLAQVGLHTPDFHASRDGAEGSLGAAGFRGLARAGVARIPAQAAFGVESAQVVTLRAEGSASIPGDIAFRVGYGILYNDAEQLAMYPYAQNVLTYRVRFEGDF